MKTLFDQIVLNQLNRQKDKFSKNYLILDQSNMFLVKVKGLSHMSLG